MPPAARLSAAASLLVPLAALAGCGPAARADAPPLPGASAAQPVVVELFQSQGCSSCPPANANVNALADRPDVIALSFAVTYWDRLGWKDTFGSPAWTARQWDYAHAAGRAQVATPQVVVNGRTAIVGSNPAQLGATLAAAGPARGGPRLELGGGVLHLSGGVGRRPATVWLVRYDPRTVLVPIRAGENGGRTLPHRDIVRALDAIGTWRGVAEAIRLPPFQADGLSEAVLVQAGTGGPITAAQKITRRV